MCMSTQNTCCSLNISNRSLSDTSEHPFFGSLGYLRSAQAEHLSHALNKSKFYFSPDPQNKRSLQNHLHLHESPSTAAVPFGDTTYALVPPSASVTGTLLYAMPSSSRSREGPDLGTTTALSTGPFPDGLDLDPAPRLRGAETGPTAGRPPFNPPWQQTEGKAERTDNGSFKKKARYGQKRVQTRPKRLPAAEGPLQGGDTPGTAPGAPPSPGTRPRAPPAPGTGQTGSPRWQEPLHPTPGPAEPRRFPSLRAATCARPLSAWGERGGGRGGEAPLPGLRSGGWARPAAEVPSPRRRRCLPWALQSAQTSLLLRRFDMVRGGSGGSGRFLPR